MTSGRVSNHQPILGVRPICFVGWLTRWGRRNPALADGFYSGARTVLAFVVVIGQWREAVLARDPSASLAFSGRKRRPQREEAAGPADAPMLDCSLTEVLPLREIELPQAPLMARGLEETELPMRRMWSTPILSASRHGLSTLVPRM